MAIGLFLKANERNTLSMAFFSSPGTLWLYSGVITRYASAFGDLAVPLPHDLVGVRRIIRVADAAHVLAEHG